MRRREIIGTPVSVTNYDEVVDAIEGAIGTGERNYVCCAPASTLVYARDDRALAQALEEADVVTPDGMGVVHAARLLGEKIEERVYGPDLMAMSLERLDCPHFLYGGFDDEALAQLQAALAERFPGLNIAGAISPPHRELNESEVSEVIEQINASGAKIVWVGIGSPKQELWMQQLRDLLDPPVLVGVGAAFDFLAGRVAQAPNWMQRSGLEWLFRIFQDPVRLGKRYALTLPRFALLVTIQALRERRLR